MDFVLDVLIPKCNLSKLNLTELLVEWGGESFSQDPPKYSNKSLLVFHQNTDMEYYKSIVGKDVDVHNYLALSMERTQLSELEFIINNQRQEMSSNEVLLFLAELYKTLDNFVIILLRDEECIDKRYTVCNEKELIKIFCESLRWSSPEGVLITITKL